MITECILLSIEDSTRATTQLPYIRDGKTWVVFEFF